MLHSKARGARQQQLAGCEERRHIMREMISPQLIFITTHTTRAHDQRIRKDGRGRRDERLMFANETHRRETTRRQGIGAKKKKRGKKKNLTSYRIFHCNLTHVRSGRFSLTVREIRRSPVAPLHALASSPRLRNDIFNDGPGSRA